MRARIIVTLKPGILDPQGKAIEGALAAVGIEGVTGVRQGKVFDLEIAGTDPEAARISLKRACARLLANMVVETFEIVVKPDDKVSPPAQPAAPAATQESVAPAADGPAEGRP